MDDLDLGTVDADLYEIRDCYDPAMAGSRWTGEALRVADQLRAEVERLRDQAAGWMEEATRQAAERDKNYVELVDARHEMDVLRGQYTDVDQRYELALAGWTGALKERDHARTELREARGVIQRVRSLHSGPRTERHGSGCVQCAICWPCPTALAVGWRDGAYPPP